jgi:hypothetical protein
LPTISAEALQITDEEREKIMKDLDAYMEFWFSKVDPKGTSGLGSRAAVVTGAFFEYTKASMTGILEAGENVRRRFSRERFANDRGRFVTPPGEPTSTCTVGVKQR